MDQNAPFKPNGPLHLLQANASGLSPTKILGPTIGAEMNYLVTNPAGANDVFIGYGPTSDIALANRVVPLIAAPSPTPLINGPQAGTLHIPGGSIHIYTLAPGMFMSPITQVGSSPGLTVMMGFGN